MKKLIVFLLTFLLFYASTLIVNLKPAYARWVSGYFRSDGTWVNGYFRTEPNYWKWDNYSWNGDWSDAINDKSWYRDFGYDPEPFDNDIPNYDYWNTHKWSRLSNDWLNDYYDDNYFNFYDDYSYLNYDYDWDYDYNYDDYDYYYDDYDYYNDDLNYEYNWNYNYDWGW